MINLTKNPELQVSQKESDNSTLLNVENDVASKTNTILNSKIPEKYRLPERYNLVHQGKVRDTYENPDNSKELIIMATDRISTHDVIHKSEIPGKGKTLTQMTKWWFNEIADDKSMSSVKTQMVENANFPADFPEELKERSIIVQKLEALPIEAIVRGYLYGSALGGYDAETGKLATGEEVGKGLTKCSEFPKPLFTPSTKDKDDTNINFEDMKIHLHENLDLDSLDFTETEIIADEIKEISISLYKFGAKKAKEKGIILGDTKFEFGLDDRGRLRLIDEVLTPDSSRFWTLEGFAEGVEPTAFDKQPVRDHVARYWKDHGPDEFGKKKYPIELPQEVIDETSQRYEEIYKLFTTKMK